MSQTKAQLIDPTDGSIVNADINASAAIAGSKISPDFGSQNIVTTGSVGIGIGSQTPSTPQKQLHIAHDSSPRIMLSNDTTGHATPNGTELLLDSGGNFEILQRENLNVEFFTNNSQRMTIDGSGNVGIGTTSPTHLLHLESASSPSINILDTTNNTKLLLYSQDANSHIGTYSNHPLVFDTNSSERMRIDTSGRLLIGHTTSTPMDNDANNPIFAVEGAGNGARIAVRSTDATASNGAFIYLTRTRGTSAGSKTTVQSGDSLGGLIFMGADGTDDTRAAIIQAQCDGTPGDNDMPGRLVFMTTPDGGINSSERMRIDSSGQVGIGTTSPNEKLVVNGNSSVTGALFITSNTSTPSAGAFLYRPASNTLAFGSNSAERMRLDSSGRLLINTTTLSQGKTPMLEVKSDSNTSADFAGVFSSANGTSGIGISYSIIEAFNNTGNATIQLKTNGTDAVRIASNQNVGIGTTNPGQRLEVRQTAASHAIIAANRANSDTFAVALGNTSGGQGVVSVNNADLVFGRDFSGTFTERMRMRNDGGLTFNGDTAAANALDDYEEGTYTPAPLDGTAQATPTDGQYTKIGNFCIVTGSISLNGDATTAGNMFQFTLPFTAGGGRAGSGVIRYTNSNHADTPNITFHVNAGQANVALYVSGGGTFTYAEAGTNRFDFCMLYRTS